MILFSQLPGINLIVFKNLAGEGGWGSKCSPAMCLDFSPAPSALCNFYFALIQVLVVAFVGVFHVCVCAQFSSA